MIIRNIGFLVCMLVVCSLNINTCEAVGLRGQDLLEEVAHAARVAEHHTVGVLIVDEVLDPAVRARARTT